MNVREILQTHSQSTTLRELEARGRSRVRVINANQIAELIEQSVRKTIAQADSPDDLKSIVEKSKVEFMALKRERDQEAAAREDGLRQLEAARGELMQLAGDAEKLLSRAESAEKRVAELEHLLACEQGRVEEARRLVDHISKERDIARRAESDARAAATSAPAAMPAESTELLAKLAAEVARLSDRMNATPPPPPPAAAMPAHETQALTQRLDALSQGIADRLERFGKTIGVSSAVEVADAKIDSLFSQSTSLESNISNLEVKERQGSGIRGALDRMKRMRLGGKPEDGAPDDAGAAKRP